MSWSFATDPEFEERLEWARRFMREKVFPLEALGDLDHETFRRLADPLKEEVKRAGLFAAHLPPEMGGGGWGQVELALLHEVVGASGVIGPIIFGNQPPDSGNAELIAIAGTDEQKERWMVPLLAGEIYSCFSMTETGRGSDPTLIETRARRDGDEWVVDGTKWFSSNASIADVFIVMARTNDSDTVHERFSMLLVPAGTPGIEVREITSMQHPYDRPAAYASEGEVTYHEVRVPASALLGEEGRGFALAQARLGPGRIHHCMRWVGQCRRAFDMLCERAVSVESAGSRLADKQMVQAWIADSYAEIEALRLMTLRAAWTIDQAGVPAARTDISAIKYFGAKILHDVIDRALQVHGSLGYSGDMPLESMYRLARAARIYDGPDEVHRVSVAKRIVRDYQPVAVPTEHVPTRLAAAQDLFAVTT
ncbi:MAG TPA: acyl-CoA dehydrogenase family protein [Iamia sp.]|nr:acyl-CoA dehydrogenase family protein [Iamia sp.]